MPEAVARISSRGRPRSSRRLAGELTVEIPVKFAPVIVAETLPPSPDALTEVMNGAAFLTA